MKPLAIAGLLILGGTSLWIGFSIWRLKTLVIGVGCIAMATFLIFDTNSDQS